MKKITVSAALVLGLIGNSPVAQADNLFSGNVRLACEAVLCLSSGSRPSECSPSLKRYFDIRKQKISDTLKARKNFLNICPSASTDNNMKSLVDAITNGAGRCDAAALNSSLMVWRWYSGYSVIRNTLPSYCNAYNNHQYTNTQSAIARYVGVPERGGFWVDPKNYDKALQEYKKRTAR